MKARGASRAALNETLVLSVLTTAVGLVAVFMVIRGGTSALEGVSFVTGAVCVWLTVRENVWNFPVGLVNTATFSVVFFEARLFGDAVLQIVYFGLGLAGWYLWLFGGKSRTPLRVTRATRIETIGVGLAVVVATLLLWKTLHYLGGSSSFWDALTTSMSLGAQWLLNRKRLENWFVWIVVDAIYVPLYFARGLNLTAILYAVFLVMAVLGVRHWKAALKPHHV